jgi:S-DNA-T family DNA segregation ATPase FtsK/SpoIIIE
MRLRWTVVDGSGEQPRTREVVVRCPRGTSLEAVLEQFPVGFTGGRAAPHPSGPVEVGGTVLTTAAVVGLPPLLDGAVVRVLDRAPARVAPAPAHLLELVVTSGPDAGTVVPLRRGRTTVGRSVTSEVRLRDPRLSREHATLTVGPDGVRLEDARADLGAPPEQREPPRLLQLGTRWRAGAGQLQLRSTASGPARAVTVTDTGDGTREVRPPPRTRTPEVAPQISLPAPARPGRTGAFPLLAVVLPALAAGGLAWWTGSVVYLALAALGPLLVAGSWWTARRDARRAGTLGRREHARTCAALRAQAVTAASALAAARGQAMPDAVTLLGACADVAGPLWERHHTHDDALRVRLGTVSSGSDAPTSGPDLTRRVTTIDHEGRIEVVATDDDLLAVDLGEGHLGVVEATDDPACARFLVGQLVALLPPTSLTVVPVVGPGAAEAWGWLALLPHAAEHPGAGVGAAPAAALRVALRLVAARAEDRGSGGAGARRPDGPAVLVVVAEVDRHVDAAELERLSGAHRMGVHVLVVARTIEGLPRVCTAVLAPCSPDGVEARLTTTADGASGRVVLDTVAPWWASRLARALAPLRLAAADEGRSLPSRVPLDDLLDLDAGAIRRRWARPAEGLPVPLGIGAHGAVTVDLTSAGPHALVAGTTGSGKSELLRSWLLAMAATQPPDRLSLLLVDYKGGATFDELTRLPHCVGLLTDLDGGATSRVLHSLRAEVRRRERLLAAAGARDLAGYRALPGGGPEPVPRLLVVVDEFRVLAEDAPDVLGQFVRLAATGRSLGIHLVLATQRPGGVVSADIRANAALRIALRVQDVGESRDVVDRPDAAFLPPAAPGRAVVVGAGLDAHLQTAWCGSTADEPTISVLLAGAPAGGTPAAAGSTANGPTVDGAARVVSAVVEAARLAGSPDARPPWLPPLPLSLSSVREALPDGGLAPPGLPGALVLGVADVPWAQARVALSWSPVQDGPLLVLGAARSGRSSTLAAAARAAGGAGVPVVHLSAGSGTEDHVVDVLSALVSPPSPGPGQVDGADPVTGPRRTLLLLLLDDADELLDPGADPTAADLLLRLVRTGHRDGIGIALAGGRGLASSRVAGAARARLVHRTVDRADAMVAGVPPGAALPSAPGRCLAVGLDLAGVTAVDHGGPASGSGTPVLEAQVLLLPVRGQEPGPGAPAARAVRCPSWVPACAARLHGRRRAPTAARGGPPARADRRGRHLGAGPEPGRPGRGGRPGRERSDDGAADRELPGPRGRAPRVRRPRACRRRRVPGRPRAPPGGGRVPTRRRIGGTPGVDEGRRRAAGLRTSSSSTTWTGAGRPSCCRWSSGCSPGPARWPTCCTPARPWWWPGPRRGSRTASAACRRWFARAVAASCCTPAGRTCETSSVSGAGPPSWNGARAAACSWRAAGSVGSSWAPLDRRHAHPPAARGHYRSGSHVHRPHLVPDGSAEQPDTPSPSPRPSLGASTSVSDRHDGSGRVGQGTIVLDSAHSSGSLVVRPVGPAVGGWEWSF